jgi:hypothetical protein
MKNYVLTALLLLLLAACKPPLDLDANRDITAPVSTDINSLEIVLPNKGNYGAVAMGDTIILPITIRNKAENKAIQIFDIRTQMDTTFFVFAGFTLPDTLNVAGKSGNAITGTLFFLAKRKGNITDKIVINGQNTGSILSAEVSDYQGDTISIDKASAVLNLQWYKSDNDSMNMIYLYAQPGAVSDWREIVLENKSPIYSVFIPKLNLEGDIQNFQIENMPLAAFTLAKAGSPGAMLKLKVRFFPTDQNMRSIRIRPGNNWLYALYCYGNAGNMTDTFDVHDKPGLCKLQPDGNLNFGPAGIGSQVRLNVKISNIASPNSKAYLFIPKLSLQGSGSSAFVIENYQNTSITLAPMQSRDFTIVFQPGSASQYNAQLALGNSTIYLSLNGTGINSNFPDTILVNDIWKSTQTTIGDSIIDITVPAMIDTIFTGKITNHSNKVVIIPSVQERDIANGDAITLISGLNPAPFALRPGESQSYSIRFRPTKAGTVYSKQFILGGNNNYMNVVAIHIRTQ